MYHNMGEHYYGRPGLMLNYALTAVSNLYPSKVKIHNEIYICR